MQQSRQSWIVSAVKRLFFPVTGLLSLLSTLSPASAQQVIPAADGAGTAVSQDGDQYDISGGTQAGGNLFHAFDEFSLAATETANFLGDSSVFNIVGQVSGAKPSYIDGTVQVSGSDANLYLVNPSGVLFGANAQLSLQGSFTATTADQVEFDGAVLNVLDQGADYSAFLGEPAAFHFTETSASAVVNQGDLAVAPGESISLTGGNVVNTGTLSAPGGEIALVAVGGESTVRYGIPGSLLSLELTDSSVPNGAGFSVTDLPALLTGSSTPVADALSLRPDGSYELGFLQIGANEVSVAGEISTRATVGDGGEIAIFGRSVDVVEAVIDASGDNGGNIRIGRDVGSGALPTSVLVWLHSTSVVRADGLAGAGGDIAVGSTRRARVQGDISAQGTTLGGLVETSSSRLNLSDVRVDASGQTEGGRWLAASNDLDIVGNALDFNQLDPSVIAATLDSGTDIEITTTLGSSGNGDIVLSESIDQNSGGSADLTLSGRRFIRNNGSTIDLSSTGALTLGINQVNAEATTDSSSIESAIAAIGNVSGNRLISLGAGTYDFDGPVSINTNVTIEGAGTNLTRLRDAGQGRVLEVLNNGDVTVRDLAFLGNATGALTGTLGGGIDVQGGALSVENSLFDGNVAAFGGAISSRPGSALTVTGSDFIGNQAIGRVSGAGGGGAIVLANGLGSTATLSDLLFQQNSSNGDAGALQIVGSDVTVSNTRFEQNTAGDAGGAVGMYLPGDVRFEGVSFENNVSQNRGGAIALWDQATLTLLDTVLSNNTAVSAGGAINGADNSSLVITRSQLNNNEVTAGSGGGLAVNASRATIDGESVLRGNRAFNDGGGIYATNNSALTIEDTDFVGNTAGRDGGGIAQSDGTLTIRGADIRSNQADGNGGGLYGESSLTVEDSEFSGNRADLAGGGLYSTGDNTVTASIFEDNDADNGGGIVVLEDASLTLDDTVVSNNRAINGYGGGLLVSDGASATVTGVLSTETGLATTATTRFESNTAGQDGGAIASNASALVIANGVLFQDNIAGDDGGGVAALEASRVVVDNSNFENNRAAQNGGGLYSNHFGPDIPGGDKAVVDNSRFINNAAANGGGFYQGLGGTAAVSESLFRANQATAEGGGLYGERDIAIADTEIIENVAQFGGGLLIDGDANLRLTNSTLAANQAVEGGGLFSRSAAELANTTISNNVATNEGGGIKNTGVNAELTVRNSTIYENEAGQGGGILAGSAQPTRVLNTIVAGNMGATGPDVRGDFEDQGNNLIGSAEGSSGFTNSLFVGTADNPIDPRLAPLADNGGPTRTHLLLADSVAINSGRADGLSVTDQRGLSRVVGLGADIGAVELDAAEIPPNPVGDVVQTTLSVVEPTLLTESEESSEELLGYRDPEVLSDNVSVRRLEQNFGQGFEDYWDLSQGQDLSFDGVQAILRRAQADYEVNSAVIYAAFVPEEKDQAEETSVLQLESEASGDDLLHLSVVMPAGELVRYELPVTRREAKRQVRMLRSTTSDPEDNFGYQPLSQQLYQWLLAPLEADLAAQGIQNLMYALDEGLRTAPVTSMSDDNGFSLERFGISVVPSVSLMQADFPASVRRSTVAMGVSEFEVEQPLPAVPIELDMVKSTVPVSQTRLNENTTSDAIASIQALEQPGVLHLATHATFDTHSPDSSAIQLWDGPWSMREFSDLDWQASNLELLILSACDTAMSSRNAELGFAGLAAAAGVDATVGSLWQVSDIGTLALMSEFYAQLEATPLRFEALRRAQLSLLNKETRIENGDLITSQGVVDLPDEWDLPNDATLDHPFFWSAFTMVGNPW